MKKRDFVRLIKSSIPVFANVKLTNSDCWYVQVVKTNLLLTIQDHSDEMIYEVVVRPDGIYID